MIFFQSLSLFNFYNYEVNNPERYDPHHDQYVYNFLYLKNLSDVEFKSKGLIYLA